MSFDSLGLDPRLLRAVSKKGFAKPTPVQAQGIPKALEGKDLVALARTGSGKTLAYVLPLLHRILNSSEGRQSWNGLILVPTKELCEQVRQEVQSIIDHCAETITVTSLTAPTTPLMRMAVRGAGNVVVATPAGVASCLRDGLLGPTTLQDHLQSLVLDEADLLLSYGYEEDLRQLAPLVPRNCQCVLMTATSSDCVEQLEKLVLHNPIRLDLLSAGGSRSLGGVQGVAAEVQHYQVACAPQDKLLHLLVMLKLGLVKKKVLVFVNSVNEGVRVRLFLESFGVRSALLNAELPLNSRSHILQTFNKGMFDHLIATDDVSDAREQEKDTDPRNGRRQDSEGPKRKKRKVLVTKDEEFGVTRGIDFRGVETVINYDMPPTVQGYVHRVGRTGRAGRSGCAISLVTPAEEHLLNELMTLGPGEHGREEAPEELAKGPTGRDQEDVEDGDTGQAASQVFLARYPHIHPSSVEALRYRAEDVLRSLTKQVIKEARARELRLEVLNSKALKEYFGDHQAEQMLLRHDKPLHKGVQAVHLKHIPGYMKGGGVGDASQGRPHMNKEDRKKRKTRRSQDPLKGISSFKKGSGKREGKQELTEMEKQAMTQASKSRSAATEKFLAKGNVRKGKRKR